MSQQQPNYVRKYAEYERAWHAHVDAVNAHRFAGGGFPARFSEKEKQEFIRTLALIDSRGSPTSTSTNDCCAVSGSR
jgi:hypothetical protein